MNRLVTYAKKAVAIIVFLLFFLKVVQGQNNCPIKNLYETNYMGDGKDSIRLYFPLSFIVKNDSIVVSIDKKGEDQFMAFRIMSKTCAWKENSNEGKVSFYLMLGDVKGNKFPTLNLTCTKEQPVYIELLYENAERRVFSQL